MGITAIDAKIDHSNAVFLASFFLKQIEPLGTFAAQIDVRLYPHLGPFGYALWRRLVFAEHAAANIMMIGKAFAQETVIAPGEVAQVFKRFMRSNAVQITLGWLVAAYMTLVKYTTRWEIEREDHIQPIIDGGKGFIALTWHSRFMMLTAAWKKNYQLPHVLISRSRDGAIVAHTSRNLAAKAKGGAKAGLDIVTALESEACIVITPDGPRGPRQRLGDGPIRLARLTGVPIVPCTFALRNRKQFNSWDKFVLPQKRSPPPCPFG